MKDLAYYNGKITSIDDMMIPANDRGFYFGDGIYEAAMVFDYKIYALQDHLDVCSTAQPCSALSFLILRKKSARF